MLYLKIFIKLILTSSLFCCMLSCSNRADDIWNKVTVAGNVIEKEPQYAQHLLQAVKAEFLDDYNYHQYILLNVRAQELLGGNISGTAEAVTKSKNYFISLKDAEKSTFACFVLARACQAQGDVVNALYNYKEADKWALNMPCRLFSLYKIPFNISALLFDLKKYDESLIYADKALQYIDKDEGKNENRVYVLELKALNFKNIGIVDSALLYYDEALMLADQYNDAVAKNRVIYNKCVLLSTIDIDYELAERNCEQSLSYFQQKNDSLALGRLYIAQSYILSNTNRNNLALTSIYTAKAYLVNASVDLQVSLYDILYDIEKKAGNHAKAAQYQATRNRYIQDIEAKRQTDEAALKAEITAQLESEYFNKVLQITESNRVLIQKQLNANRMATLYLIIGGILITCIVWFIFVKITRAKRLLKYKLMLAQDELNITYTQITALSTDFRASVDEQRKKDSPSS